MLTSNLLSYYFIPISLKIVIKGPNTTLLVILGNALAPRTHRYVIWLLLKPGHSKLEQLMPSQK